MDDIFSTKGRTESELAMMDWIKETPDDHPSKWKITYGLFSEIWEASWKAAKDHEPTEGSTDK